MHPFYRAPWIGRRHGSQAVLLAAGEPSRGVPLRPAGDPEEKSSRARTGEARWLFIRETGSESMSDTHVWPGAQADSARLHSRGQGPYGGRLMCGSSRASVVLLATSRIVAMRRVEAVPHPMPAQALTHHDAAFREEQPCDG